MWTQDTVSGEIVETICRLHNPTTSPATTRRSGPISAGLVITEHTTESWSLLSTRIMGGKYRDMRYANFAKLRQFLPLR